MDPRTVELLNLELDGRIDAAGRAELDARLAADPAVREHRAQLHAMARALAEAPAPDLPPAFVEGVLQRARWRRPRAGAKRLWRAGLALAASVLAAVVVLRVVDPAVDVNGLSATLAPVTPTATVTRREDDVLAVTFDLPATPGDLVIECGPGAALRAKGDVALRIEGRRIVAPGVAGHASVEIAGATGTITATVIRDGIVTPVTIRSR